MIPRFLGTMSVMLSTVWPVILVFLRNQMIDDRESLKSNRENEPWFSVVRGGLFVILFVADISSLNQRFTI